MMTLYRKKIVRGRTHVIVYSACLVLSAFHICRLLGLTSCLFVLGAFCLRVNLPRAYSNKYAIWITFLLAHNYRDMALPFLAPLISVINSKLGLGL